METSITHNKCNVRQRKFVSYIILLAQCKSWRNNIFNITERVNIVSFFGTSCPLPPRHRPLEWWPVTRMKFKHSPMYICIWLCRDSRRKINTKEKSRNTKWVLHVPRWFWIIESRRPNVVSYNQKWCLVGGLIEMSWNIFKGRVIVVFSVMTAKVYTLY